MFAKMGEQMSIRLKILISLILCFILINAFCRSILVLRVNSLMAKSLLGNCILDYNNNRLHSSFQNKILKEVYQSDFVLI